MRKLRVKSKALVVLVTTTGLVTLPAVAAWANIPHPKFH